MPKYKFKAKRKDGEEYTGVMEVESRFELARKLRDSGEIVLSASPVKEGGFSQLVNRINTALNRVKLKELILFANNLGTMIEAGFSLSRSLSVVKRQSKNPKLQSVVEALLEDVNKGKNFSDALAKFPKIFPPIFSSMVKAGEESGNLPEALHLIGEQLEKSYALKKKIRGAMIYPVIVIVVIIIIGILMMIYMVPTLAATFEDLGADLPVQTRIIIAISDFTVANIQWMILGALVLVAAFLRFRTTPTGKHVISYMILHLPLIKKVAKEANSALTMRTLSSLVASGVSIVEALEITKQVLQNPYYIAVLERAESEVQKGENLSNIFTREEQLYPVMVGEMIAVGEETGKLSEMLYKGAVFYESEVDAVTKNLATVIEPLLMVFVGAAVGFFALAMIQPMYSLGDFL